MTDLKATNSETLANINGLMDVLEEVNDKVGLKRSRAIVGGLLRNLAKAENQADVKEAYEIAFENAKLSIERG